MAERLPEMSQLWRQTLNWQPSTGQQQQFQQLYERILQGNQSLNLTRITDAQEFWEKHIWDSLCGIASFLGNLQTHVHAQVIDIGTGAGFPGLPIAIARPDWTVTLLDATHKKIAFLEQVRQHLALDHVKTLTARSEQIGHFPAHREHYDLALIRAVAAAAVCAEYALPLLKLHGTAIIYRGQWSDSETQALQPAVERLGGTIATIESAVTPITQSIRHTLYLQKVRATPAEFPRAIGVPVKHPLATV